jgi:hypothetical protein
VTGEAGFLIRPKHACSRRMPREADRMARDRWTDFRPRWVGEKPAQAQVAAWARCAWRASLTMGCFGLLGRAACWASGQRASAKGSWATLCCSLLVREEKWAAGQNSQ